MKTMKQWTLTACLLIAGLSFSAFATAAADNDALETVEDYLAALMAGDVEGVRETLGGFLASERDALLSNPNYSTSLRRAYAGADYRIVHSEQLPDGSARVDAELLLADDQALSVQFVLEAQDSGYKIVSEN